MQEADMKLMKRINGGRGSFRLAIAVYTVMFSLGVLPASFAATAQQKRFSSAEEAVKAAITATRANNDQELLAIFGAQSKDLISSGDAIADKDRRGRFLAAYDEKNRLATEGK